MSDPTILPRDVDQAREAEIPPMADRREGREEGPHLPENVPTVRESGMRHRWGRDKEEDEAPPMPAQIQAEVPPSRRRGSQMDGDLYLILGTHDMTVK